MKSLLVVTSFLGVALASTATTGSTTATTASTTATTASTTATTATTLTTSHTTHTTHSTHHTHKTHKHHHHHHHHHDPCCHSSKHHKPCHSSKHHHKPCCETKTVTTVIDRKPCCLYVFPCPTNTTSYITSTVTLAPTSQAVAPVVCTPCTSVITQTVRPAQVCTTMIFCDVADQSQDCRLFNEARIESIAQLALRSGGNVYVNGQLVVFAAHQNGNGGSGHGQGDVHTSTRRSTKIVSSSSVVTVTGLNANDAPAAYYGATLMSIMAALAMAVFAI